MEQGEGSGEGEMTREQQLVSQLRARGMSFGEIRAQAWESLKLARRHLGREAWERVSAGCVAWRDAVIAATDERELAERDR